MIRLALFIIFVCTASWAVEPDEILTNVEYENRARSISKNLRCLVCRNENIDSSNAGIAKDLRVLVRERIKEGDTNEEVLDFVIDRYGEYVLLNPKISFQNLLLWISGPLFLLIGGVISWRYARVKHPVILQKLSDDEKIRLKEIMDD